MRNSTGYVPTTDYKDSKPDLKPSSMVALNTPKPVNDNLLDIVENLFTKYVKQLAASDRTNRKNYNKFLPKNDILIKINSDDYTNSIEFARILCSALDIELLAKAEIHTDFNDVEISCQIHGPKDDCFNTVKQLTDVMAETWKEAVIKLGKVDIEADVIMNKKSYYQEINIKFAETEYRKFQLKFAQNHE